MCTCIKFLYRRHYLEFPYGALNKPLEKLLRCDNRLFQLSRQPFPTLDSPYFDKQAAYFSLDFGGQPFSFSNVAPHFHADQQTYHDDHQKPQKPLNFNDSRSPLSGINLIYILSNQYFFCVTASFSLTNT